MSMVCRPVQPSSATNGAGDPWTHILGKGEGGREKIMPMVFLQHLWLHFTIYAFLPCAASSLPPRPGAGSNGSAAFSQMQHKTDFSSG